MNIDEELRIEIERITKTYDKDIIGGFITGHGKIPSNILFVGEAPGKTEVETGKPFVGMAGKTFESYLDMINIDRKDVRITNTCFFRPIKKKVSKKGRVTISNRPPSIKEINLFKDVLDKEIKAVNPKIIVTLGNTPLKRLTNFKSIGTCHGLLYFNEEINRWIFPMYHPSSLTYNRSEDFLNMYQDDFLKLKEELKKIARA